MFLKKMCNFDHSILSIYIWGEGLCDGEIVFGVYFIKIALEYRQKIEKKSHGFSFFFCSFAEICLDSDKIGKFKLT